MRVFIAESDTGISVGLHKCQAHGDGPMQRVGPEFFVFRPELDELIEALREAARLIDATEIVPGGQT